MVHELSLACYMNARQNPDIPTWQYADLEQLLHRFGKLDTDEVPVLPDHFAFSDLVPHILVVEDEVELAELVKATMVSRGYPSTAISLVTTGEDATDFIKRNRVDIALIDIKLRDYGTLANGYLSGLHVIRAIRQASPRTKAIIASGFVTYQMVWECIFELGASYCLRKPFKQQDLLRVIHWAVSEITGIEPTVPDAPSVSTLAGDGGILVVDDDVAVADSLVQVLDELGYAAEAVHNGFDALNRLKLGNIDAVFLDIYMPEMDGLKVLERIRKDGHKPRVLMLTAIHDEAIARKAMALGADDFLIKPYDTFLVQLSLEYALAKS